MVAVSQGGQDKFSVEGKWLSGPADSEDAALQV